MINGGESNRKLPKMFTDKNFCVLKIDAFVASKNKIISSWPNLLNKKIK